MERRPEVRVSDRERREVDELLRSAHEEGMLDLGEYDERSQACFAARFRPELDELLADLPEEMRVAPPAAPAPTVHETVPAPSEPTRVEARPAKHKSWWGKLVGFGVAGALAISVLGAAQGAAVLGSRTVTVAPGQDSVEVGVLFGSTRVVVPDGVRASTSGVVVFGSTSCDAACAVGSPDAAEVTVSGRGAFGSVEVITPAEAARGDELPELPDLPELPGLDD